MFGGGAKPGGLFGGTSTGFGAGTGFGATTGFGTSAATGELTPGFLLQHCLKHE